MTMMSDRYLDPPDYDTAPCDGCETTGQVTCPQCKGEPGEDGCDRCDGNGSIVCPLCKGAGERDVDENEIRTMRARARTDYYDEHGRE